MGPVSSLITKKLDDMVTAGDRDLIFSKRKAISTLFPYAICLERDGEHGMADAISRVAEASNSSKFIWHRIGHYISRLFEKPRSPSLNWVVALASPQVPWDGKLHNKDTITRWGAAVSAIPYTEEVGQCVVDALLRIAHVDSLRSGIPPHVWTWLKEVPSFSPPPEGYPEGSERDVFHHVRGLGDIEILKPYLLLIWSQLGFLEDSCFTEMQASIREDFNGIEAGRHRRDLMELLDQRLEDIEEISSAPDYGGGVGSGRAELEQYRELKKVLVEVDREAVRLLTGVSPRPTIFNANADFGAMHSFLINLQLCSTLLYLCCIRDLDFGVVGITSYFCTQTFALSFFLIAHHCYLNSCRPTPVFRCFSFWPLHFSHLNSRGHSETHKTQTLGGDSVVMYRVSVVSYFILFSVFPIFHATLFDDHVLPLHVHITTM